jgi:hypothetical protein
VTGGFKMESPHQLEEHRPRKKYVEINPNDVEENYLYVIIQSETGVVYRHQCEGLATSQNEVEGFLIPLDGKWYSKPLLDFFSKYEGWPPGLKKGSKWEESDLDELSKIISKIPIWHNHIDCNNDERVFLVLDLQRKEELTEAWVPVITPYGKGILVFENCD